MAKKDINHRRLMCYPSERNVSIFIAICHKSNKRKASLMHEIFKNTINKLSDEEKAKYIELYKTLTPEQIKNVGYKNDDDGC